MMQMNVTVSAAGWIVIKSGPGGINHAYSQMIPKLACHVAAAMEVAL